MHSLKHLFNSLVKECLALLVSGHRLDTLARMALWDVGLDYLHGTGHGIGSFLNVHEGMLCACVRACLRGKMTSQKQAGATREQKSPLSGLGRK